MDDAITDVLIETQDGILHAAAVAGRELVEFVVEPRTQAGAVGSIYLGRVVRGAAQLKAVFVDVGLERPAMLDTEKQLIEGTALPVQVIEVAHGGKGCRVTRRLAVEGRFTVLLPNGKGVSVSRRITADKARQRLQDMAIAAKQAGEGLIVRSAAAGADRQQMLAEVETLRARWTHIESLLKSAKPPVCVLDTSDGLGRLLRRFAAAEWPKFVFADALLAKRAQSVAAALFGSGPEIVSETGPGSLFDHHGIADTLATSHERMVSLPSGGRIIIEQTAALLAIDVDTADASERKDAMARTNLEAAHEVGRQLRLRDVGGLIVVDFGHAMTRSERNKVVAALSRSVAYDRVNVQLVGWTRSGMFEIIRPRARAAGTME
jgi:ribonuclease G